jgi:hypothetical protein
MSTGLLKPTLCSSAAHAFNDLLLAMLSADPVAVARFSKDSESPERVAVARVFRKLVLVKMDRPVQPIPVESDSWIDDMFDMAGSEHLLAEYFRTKKRTKTEVAQPVFHQLGWSVSLGVIAAELGEGRGLELCHVTSFLMRVGQGDRYAFLVTDDKDDLWFVTACRDLGDWSLSLCRAISSLTLSADYVVVSRSPESKTV